FRRLSRESVLPCGVRTFLDAARGAAVTRPARRILPLFRRNRCARAGACRTRDSARAGLRAGRTPRTPGIRARLRAGARGAPTRASGGGERPSCELPEHPHDLAEDLHVLGVDRLEGAVLGLQPDAALLAVERLDRRL